jgi:hypothetical protein
MLQDGQVSAVDPSGLPQLSDGTGMLMVPASSFKKAEQLESFRREVITNLLAEGTILLCRVGWKRVPAALRPRCKRARLEHSARYGAFVEVVLAGALKLRMMGAKKGSFEDVRCIVPALQLEAASLNEAYRKISEKFEPDRRSFGGSVFQSMYAFEPHNRRWVPLEDLRDMVRLTTRELAKATIFDS